MGVSNRSAGLSGLPVADSVPVERGDAARNRAVLLDEDEKAQQQAFMFGPPPLGPGAPPLDRLLAYGRERLQFVWHHRALLSDVWHDPATRFNAPTNLHRIHIRTL